MPESASTSPLAARLDVLAGRLNHVLEWTCGLLIAVMVVIVWIGVFSRYLVDMDITWTEELARYVMIWGALLAVPIGAYRREHIGLDLIFQHLPPSVQHWLRLVLDGVGLAFFCFLTWFGIGMTIKGASQYATIFSMTMAVPFASVPVSSALTVLMIGASINRTLGNIEAQQPEGELLND